MAGLHHFPLRIAELLLQDVLLGELSGDGSVRGQGGRPLLLDLRSGNITLFECRLDPLEKLVLSASLLAKNDEHLAVLRHLLSDQRNLQPQVVTTAFRRAPGVDDIATKRRFFLIDRDRHIVGHAQAGGDIAIIVDFEQDLSFFDDFALLRMNLRDLAGTPRFESGESAHGHQNPLHAFAARVFSETQPCNDDRGHDQCADGPYSVRYR